MAQAYIVATQQFTRILRNVIIRSHMAPCNGSKASVKARADVSIRGGMQCFEFVQLVMYALRAVTCVATDMPWNVRNHKLLV